MKIKRVCEKCGRKLRSVVKIKVLNEYRCSSCLKKYGTNRFYEPPEIRGTKEKVNKKKRLTLDDTEKKIIWIKEVKQSGEQYLRFLFCD